MDSSQSHLFFRRQIAQITHCLIFFFFIITFPLTAKSQSARLSAPSKEMTALLRVFEWIEKFTPSMRSPTEKETALTFGKNTAVSDRKHREIHQFGLNVSEGREGLLRTVGRNMHHLCTRQ